MNPSPVTGGPAGQPSLVELSSDPVQWEELTGIPAAVTAAELLLARMPTDYVLTQLMSTKNPAVLSILARRLLDGLGSTDSEDLAFYNYASFKIITNPALPEEYVLEFVTHSPENATMLLQTGKASSRVIEAAANTGMRQRESLLAGLENTPVHLLESLLGTKNEDIALLLACNPTSTPAMLDVLADRPSSAVLRTIAGRVDTLPGTLAKLSKHRRGDIRELVALHPSTPLACVRELARHPVLETRRAVAERADLPQDIIDELITDGRCDRALAGNPTIPVNTLVSILTRRAAKKPQDRETQLILELLAGRDDLPADAVEANVYNAAFAQFLNVGATNVTPLAVDRMLHHTSTVVRWAALKDIPLTLALAIEYEKDNQIEGQLFYRLAQNPKTHPDELTTLAGSTSRHVRKLVAGNPGTPENTLRLLSGDLEMSVVAAVAGNPLTPRDLLWNLAGIDNPEVRQACAGNPAAQPELLTSLLDLDDEGILFALAANEATPLATLRLIAGTHNAYVEAELADNPSVDEDILAGIQTCKSVAITRLIQHPKITDAIIANLYHTDRGRMCILEMDNRGPLTRKAIRAAHPALPSLDILGAVADSTLTHEEVTAYLPTALGLAVNSHVSIDDALEAALRIHA